MCASLECISSKDCLFVELKWLLLSHLVCGGKGALPAVLLQKGTATAGLVTDK